MFRDIDNGIIESSWKNYDYMNESLYQILNDRINMTYDELEEESRLTGDYSKLLLILRNDNLIMAYKEYIEYLSDDILISLIFDHNVRDESTECIRKIEYKQLLTRDYNNNKYLRNSQSFINAKNNSHFTYLIRYLLMVIKLDDVDMTEKILDELILNPYSGTYDQIIYWFIRYPRKQLLDSLTHYSSDNIIICGDILLIMEYIITKNIINININNIIDTLLTKYSVNCIASAAINIYTMNYYINILSIIPYLTEYNLSYDDIINIINSFNSIKNNKEIIEYINNIFNQI